jgi:rhamnose transport system permease protein
MPRREVAIVLTLWVIALALGVVAPGYFAAENLRDLLLANLPVLIVAIGTTLVVLSAEIDISAGSLFAVCSVVAGIVAKTTGSVWLSLLVACGTGAGVGLLTGVLVAYARIPSIVVTLAMMVALRDGLRWATGGAWVTDLPRSFQWFGLQQSVYPAAAAALSIFLCVLVAWSLRYTVAGRWVYAVGSNSAAARLAGIRVERVKCLVFVIAGALTAVGAVLNAARFNQVPSNGGIGLEMQVIAAVVVGGAAVTGGSGTITGTLLGVTLLGMVEPALTFLGVSPYWERALQGLIILAAVGLDAWRRHPAMRKFGRVEALPARTR